MASLIDIVNSVAERNRLVLDSRVYSSFADLSSYLEKAMNKGTHNRFQAYSAGLDQYLQGLNEGSKEKRSDAEAGACYNLGFDVGILMVNGANSARAFRRNAQAESYENAILQIRNTIPMLKKEIDILKEIFHAGDPYDSLIKEIDNIKEIPEYIRTGLKAVIQSREETSKQIVLGTLDSKAVQLLADQKDSQAQITAGLAYLSQERMTDAQAFFDRALADGLPEPMKFRLNDVARNIISASAALKAARSRVSMAYDLAA